MKTVLSNTTGRSFAAQIKERLLLEIKCRPVDDRLPPETQLAETYGVNRLTVNRVMRELRHEGYIERSRGKGTFIVRHEKPMIIEPDPRRKNGEIVIAYPNYYSPDLWSKVNCAEELAHANDVAMVDFKMNRETTYEAVAALIRSKRSSVKGAVILPSGSDVDAKALALLGSLGVPVVLLAACDPTCLGSNLVAIHRDYFKEGHQCVDYLFRAGHQKLGYIVSEPWNLGSRLQYAGVKAAMYAHGMKLKDIARSSRGIAPWENSMEGGYRFTAELLRSRQVTGIIYRSLPGAIGGMRAIHEAGLRVPDDVSLMAEGEFGGLEEYLVPAVTTLVCSYRSMLGAAFDAILNPSGRHERQIVIDVQIVERKSVRTLRPGAPAGPEQEKELRPGVPAGPEQEKEQEP